MRPLLSSLPIASFRFFLLLLAGLCASPTPSQTASPTPGGGLELYQALKAFSLTGGSVRAENLVLKRDRALMTFNGTFYFAAPVAGRVTGAVFLGQGSFRAEVPPSDFERESLRRLLKTDVIESDFETAVLRFTDDTFEVIGKGANPGGAPSDALKLAAEFEPRFLKETGANVSARLAVSLLNNETPGFFLAQFDKGKRGRFTCLLDFQGRLPVANFSINGGEKGLIFTYRRDSYGNDVWMAFYALDDYARGRVSYSDAFDLVETSHYSIDVDLREPKKLLREDVHMDLKSLAPAIRAIPFNLSESLGEYDNMRLKKAMRVKSAKISEANPVEYVQEDWEGGLTVFLPAPLTQGQKTSLEMHIEGDFMVDIDGAAGNHYPLSNSTWYPRHGYLGRSTFNLTFHHRKKLRVSSVGQRVREELDPANKDDAITQFKLDVPVALITFAIGPFERHAEVVKRKDGPDVPVEFYSMPGGLVAIKEDFIVAEMMNSLNYFSAIFGPYPYPSFRATVHPFGFGQGFPTMLMIPPTDRANKYTFSFIAHETAHQWWGDIVLWRSYRDQWLSEGFAEYSGVLYTGLRDKRGSQRELLQGLRDSLKDVPQTELGVGKGRLTDVGPIIMGHRLATRESVDAYGTLIYNKGALVLRMLHFLFTDPNSGNGQAFFDMMTDFVKRHQNGWATTESFMAVANEHFVRTPVAQRYQIKNLNWFFSQWVYQTHLPIYRMEYYLEPQPDGTVVARGTVFQDGIPESEKWFMPLPVLIRLSKDKVGRGLVHALGPQAQFALRLPAKPESIELDPEWWVISEKTSTKALKGK